MKKLRAWLGMVRDHVKQDFDRITLVIGDEGMGKSTLMLELGWMWLDVLDQEPTVEDTLEQTAWDYDEYKDAMASNPPYSCITIHDAARVLSRKKAMHSSQIELEEDLLDVRFGNYLMLLGFQEFNLVPTMLAERRAKNALVIPKRGVVHGYSQKGVQKRYEDGKWPKPAIVDRFPDLEGKALWRAFRDEDQRRKQERIAAIEEEEGGNGVKELAEQIVQEGIDIVVAEHGGHGNLYISADLIEVEYEVSGNMAKKTATYLNKKVDVAR